MDLTLISSCQLPQRLLLCPVRAPRLSSMTQEHPFSRIARLAYDIAPAREQGPSIAPPRRPWHLNHPSPARKFAPVASNHRVRHRTHRNLRLSPLRAPPAS